MPQVIVGRELHEFELRHEHRTKPPALCHLLGSESLAPPPAVCLREIGKRAALDLQALEAFGQQSAGCRREAVASARNVD